MDVFLLHYLMSPKYLGAQGRCSTNLCELMNYALLLHSPAEHLFLYLSAMRA